MKLNSVLYKLSKINLLANTAHQVYDYYKSVKLNFVDFRYDEAKNPSISKEQLIEYNKNRKFAIDKNICFAPKKSMIFSFNGTVYLCCDNTEAPIGDITKENLHDIWFGEKRKFLDEAINKDYNLDYGCNNCKYKIIHKNYSTVQAQNFDLYTTNKSPYPARLEFEIQNTCNLECVMCDGIHSSSIHSNRNKLPSIPMVYSSSFVDQLDEFIPHLKSINLLGGEPTLIKIYYEIIEKVIKLNPDCFIHLQTNASSINKRFKELLEKGNFEIGLSIDSLNKELAEKIRKNLDFDKFMDTTHYYLELHKTNKIKVTINTCVMPNNWRELIPIIRFCNQHQLTIFICVVTVPYYNSFISVSSTYIEFVSRELCVLMQDLPQTNYYEKNNYNQLNDFLNMLKAWNKSILENEDFRNSNSETSVEELYKLLETKMLAFFTNEQQRSITDEMMDYVKMKFAELDDTDKKELIISLMNVLKSQEYMSYDKDYFKKFSEFINNLVFSYKERNNYQLQ